MATHSIALPIVPSRDHRGLPQLRVASGDGLTPWAAMVRKQKIHIDANPAAACIRRDRPSSHDHPRGMAKPGSRHADSGDLWWLGPCLPCNVGQDPATQKINLDFAIEARQSIKNLEAILKAADLSLADVVKVNVTSRRREVRRLQRDLCADDAQTASRADVRWRRRPPKRRADRDRVRRREEVTAARPIMPYIASHRRTSS